jgi:predicted SprT family Zn-dependent metalloprotease
MTADYDVTPKDSAKDYSDAALHAAAQRVANVYARIVNRKIGCTIPIPLKMQFELEFVSMEMAKAAGRAHSTMMIDINMTLFRENIEHILNHTIPHEMGHLVQYNKFDHKGLSTPGHGVHWQESMRIMGKTPHKYHALDVKNAIKAYKDHQKAKKAKAKAKAEKD